MGKVKISMKEIRNSYKKVFRTGYCELHNIMYTNEPQFHNCGTYGWNCDIYVNYSRDIAVTTGYRNMAGTRIHSEIIQKYNAEAEKIIGNHGLSLDKMMELLDENLENFWNELENI